MGVDAVILVRAKKGVSQPELGQGWPNGFEVVRREGYPDWATHKVESFARYYGDGYERGPWPSICAALMVLLASPDVEGVWYLGDDDEPMRRSPTTDWDVLRISHHFMKYGNRPYYKL